MPEPIVRAATEADFAAVTEIYNHYVRETPITFDLEEFTVDQRREWFGQFADTGAYRLLVAESDGAISGYACSTKVRPKAAYDSSVEVTIYVTPGSKRRGIGRAIYTELFTVLYEEGLHRAYAVITLPNDPSIRIHEAFGFTYTGTLHEVGRKFERYWDVAWYEKDFD